MKKLSSLSLLTLILSFAACKKYEDGPGISFRTAEARISNHWEIENYYIDGYDRLDEFDRSPLYCGVYAFSTHGQAPGVYSVRTYSCANGPVFGGWWSLSNENKSLELTMNLVDNPQHPLETYNTWKILRLTKKEFWIETTLDNHTYEIHFKQT